MPSLPTDEDVARYRTDGAICLRGAFSTEWIERLRGAVDDDIATARELGITGVPFTAINGRWGIPGAQPVDVFLRSIERVGLGREAFGQR